MRAVVWIGVLLDFVIAEVTVPLRLALLLGPALVLLPERECARLGHGPRGLTNPMSLCPLPPLAPP